jgi:hypothetical protein
MTRYIVNNEDTYECGIFAAPNREQALTEALALFGYEGHEDDADAVKKFRVTNLSPEQIAELGYES